MSKNVKIPPSSLRFCVVCNQMRKFTYDKIITHSRCDECGACFAKRTQPEGMITDEVKELKNTIRRLDDQIARALISATDLKHNNEALSMRAKQIKNVCLELAKRVMDGKMEGKEAFYEVFHEVNQDSIYVCPKCGRATLWCEVSSGGDGYEYCPDKKCGWVEDFSKPRGR